MSYLTKKTVQGLDSFHKLNEKEVPLLTASPSTEISETQPPVEESTGFHKTPSNAINGI